MSTLQGLLGVGGGGGGGSTVPINGIAKLNVNEDLYTDENTQVWLRGNNFIAAGFEEYPDAETFDYNFVGQLLSNSGISAEGTSLDGVFFKPDGTKMYLGNQSSASGIAQYSLSVPYDISTATISGKSGNTGEVYGLYISPDGTKGFWNTNDTRIGVFTMATAWDITTATFVGGYYINDIVGSVIIGNIGGISANPTGTRLYLVGYSDGGETLFWQFSMSTAWDPGTLSLYASRKWSSSLDNYFGGLFISEDQQNMFIAQNDFAKITKFTGNATSDGNGMYFATEGITSIAPVITADAKKNFSFMGGNKIGITTTNDVYQVDLSVAFNATTMAYNGVRTYGLRGLVSGSFKSVLFADSGSKMYVATAPFYHNSYITNITQLNASTPYSISELTAGTSVSIANRGTFFNISGDGSWLYLSSTSGNIIYKRALSTPWDLSTAGGETAITFLQVPNQPIRFCFKSDGTILYISCNGVLYRYSLSTPWDASTSTYIGLTYTVGGVSTVPFWIDANYIYAYGGTGSTLTIYKMATQWDPTVYTVYRNIAGQGISNSQVINSSQYYSTASSSSNMVYERELPTTIGMTSDINNEFLRIK
jgi:hypothetical protein